MQLTGVYHSGQFKPNAGFIYCAIINNFAQIWAMYCLIMFYHACAAELKPLRPLPKFLCIKMVVFLSFWQGIIMGGLGYGGYLNANVAAWVGYAHNAAGVEELGAGLQDFLICIEMFLASIGHFYAFSHEDFKLAAKPRMTIGQKVKAVFDVEDVKHDMYGHVRDVSTGVVALPVAVGKAVENKVVKVGAIIRRGGETPKHGTTDKAAEEALLRPEKPAEVVVAEIHVTSVESNPESQPLMKAVEIHFAQPEVLAQTAEIELVAPAEKAAETIQPKPAEASSGSQQTS